MKLIAKSQKLKEFLILVRILRDFQFEPLKLDKSVIDK